MVQDFGKHRDSSGDDAMQGTREEWCASVTGG